MKLKTLLLLGIALLAAYMGGRALRRNAEVIQALWALIGMTALSGTANTPKTRSTEARLNSLVPVIFPNTGGTVNGAMTVNGTHSVNGNSNVSGSVSAGTRGTFGGDVITSGTISNPSGTLTTNGSHFVTGGFGTGGGAAFGGGVNVTGTVSATGDMILSGQLSSPGGQVTTNGNHQVTGRVTASAMTLAGSHVAPVGRTSLPGSPSGTYNPAWAASVTNVLANVVNSLVSAGIFT
jgi:hypothetical protein